MKKTNFYFIIVIFYVGGGILQASHESRHQKPIFGPETKQLLQQTRRMFRLAINGGLTETELQEYINQGGKINVQNNNGATLLMTSIRQNRNYSYASSNLLLKNKVDPDMQNKHGETALSYAAIYRNPDIVQLLLDYKANPNLPNNTGDTPLNIAAQYNYNDLVIMFLKNGADPYIKNKQHLSFFDIYSGKLDNPEIQKALENNIWVVRKQGIEKNAIQHQITKTIITTTPELKSSDIAEIIAQYSVELPTTTNSTIKPEVEKPIVKQ